MRASLSWSVCGLPVAISSKKQKSRGGGLGQASQRLRHPLRECSSSGFFLFSSYSGFFHPSPSLPIFSKVRRSCLQRSSPPASALSVAANDFSSDVRPCGLCVVCLILAPIAKRLRASTGLPFCRAKRPVS
ncbi:hypothetical protein GQ53DRAFT_139337 [Thozetella sp. PMI_491]|nr:hypothetical protein GQ53DRAFT_139337 [Thozetella sp. PMI_491]